MTNIEEYRIKKRPYDETWNYLSFECFIAKIEDANACCYKYTDLWLTILFYRCLNDKFCYGASILLQHNDPWNKNKVEVYGVLRIRDEKDIKKMCYCCVHFIFHQILYQFTCHQYVGLWTPVPYGIDILTNVDCIIISSVLLLLFITLLLSKINI